jgi:predicted AAA+ superfamily ATPase
MLSVLTLIVMDELEEHDIKYILYCDDGLMYSDKDLDFKRIAQEILDVNNIGAFFADSKSKWIKREGV